MPICVACSGDTLEISCRLDVHRKTVLDRLDDIQAETGMDFSDAEQMLLVRIGLRILKMEEAIDAAQRYFPSRTKEPGP